MAPTQPMPDSPSGDWRVSLLAAKGVKAAFDTVELTLEGKTSTFDLAEGDGKKTSGDETVLHVSKTFYLYGHGEHKTPLAITLKQGDKVVGTASLPHDKAETTEDWLSLATADGKGKAGQLRFRSQWVSKIYVTPTGTNYLLPLAYLLLFALWALSNVVLIPVTFNLLATSVAIIYIGCHRSLALRDKGAMSDEEQLETISKEDAYKFPLIGSCVLFGLYVAFKFFDKDWVNWLLAVYFSVIGAAMLTCTFEPPIALVLRSQKTYGPVFTLPLIGKCDLRFTVAEMAAGVVAITLAGYWFKTKHWVLNNGFGIAFCIQGLERISLGSYKVGAILLTGLFFYDIFWVFGTEVMVTVAKSFDAPIKLLFPRQFASETTKLAHSMLGLGDIVIPGIFIALLLRYDAERLAISPKASPAASFSKPFFHASIVAYTLGLGTTIFVMNYFHAAQPALLYLVPACLLSSGATALALKEFKALLAYDEEEPEHPAEAAAEEKKEK